MSSYGDPPSARARASVPGPSGAPDGEVPKGSASYRKPAGGRASVGSASVGSAAAGAASARASVGTGRASIGSARVGAAGAGRAAVGAASARASVRPLPVDGDLLSSSDPDKGGKGSTSKRSKRRRRANIITAAAAVLVIMLGTGVVAFTWLYDSVQDIQPKADKQTNSYVDASGKEISKSGTNRTLIPHEQINPIIRQAVMAAEDKGFEEHNGIDMIGIARAAWNNLTNDDQQGASTITQQLARHASNEKDITYGRKAREAVMARKIESAYSKEEIIGFYLNGIYFGRGANGIEAATQAYFGKSAATKPGDPNAVTFEEAAVIASVIKQPEPSSTHQGYDPQNQKGKTDAKDRWNYTLNNMVDKGWITPQQRAAAVYPEKSLKEYNPKACRLNCAASGTKGHFLKKAEEELSTLGFSEEEIANGGLVIKTTLNPQVQEAAENAARRESEKSPLNGFPDSYHSALVAIDPQSGDVMAYYGGNDNGTFTDYADSFKAPGSTFKVYTLAAALREKVSFNSYWDFTKKKEDNKEINNAGRNSRITCGKSCPLEKATTESWNFPFYWLAHEDGVGVDKVLAAARDAGIRTIHATNGDEVKLDNTTLKGMGDKFGPELGFGQYPIKPLEHASGAATLAAGGIYHKPHFISEVKKRNPQTGKLEIRYKHAKKSDRKFDADIMADLDGVLQKIPKSSNNVLAGDRKAIAKTGTWELGSNDKKLEGASGDAWMIGGTPQIAAAVWIGNEVKKGDETIRSPITVNGKPNGKAMSGGSVPGAVWKKFLDAAHRALNLEEKDFPARVATGDPESPIPNGEKPAPQTPVCDVTSPPSVFCPNPGQQGPPGQGGPIIPPPNPGQPDGNGNGNGRGNGNGNNGNGNNGNGNDGGQNNGDIPEGGGNFTLPD